MTRLPRIVIRDIVARALAEDIGSGDLTTDNLVEADARGASLLVARDDGIIAGLELAEETFRALDQDIDFAAAAGVCDGQRVARGDTVAQINGSTRALLSGERVALNFMTHLSGIATLTARYVAAVAGTRARIADTRKTLPGLRVLEKYAVRAGGGVNHRFGLDDAVMIKDNHIAALGGIASAIARARAGIGHMVKISCEVDRLDQIEEAVSAGADIVLLDNMDPRTLAIAVGRIRGRALAEASGGVSLDSVAAIAAAGVDIISIGRLTHSAPALDLALDFLDLTDLGNQ